MTMCAWARRANPWSRSVYSLARRADHDPAARDRIQDIAVQFLGFQQVQRAFQREFEQVSALADQVPALSEKSTALQALISDREAQLTAIGAQAQESAARAAATLAELEHQKAAYADLVEQRDVLARSAEDMRSEIARLSEAVEQRDVLARSAEDMRSEIARLSEAVEQRDVLALSAEDMRSEIARLSEAVAAAQLREDELERIRKQVAALREAVMQAERKAREHATVEAVIRADMADAIQAFHGRSEQVEILKSELAHAREIGRATLQALAASRLATAYREPRLGWRQSLRRLFGSARGS
jgi:chromosome segregation ATPase